jgi:hypothetical protein
VPAALKVSLIGDYFPAGVDCETLHAFTPGPIAMVSGERPGAKVKTSRLGRFG